MRLQSAVHVLDIGRNPKRQRCAHEEIAILILLLSEISVDSHSGNIAADSLPKQPPSIEEMSSEAEMMITM